MADHAFLETLMAVRDRAIELGADFAELRGFRGESTTLLLQDGDIHKIDRNLELGACVRILLDGAWGFASANATRKNILLETLDRAMDMARSGRRRGYNEGAVARAEPVTGAFNVPPQIDPRNVPVDRKCDFLTRMESDAVKAGRGKVVNTRFIYHDETASEYLANSFGTEMENTMPRIHAIAVVTARDGDVRQQTYVARGEVAGFEMIQDVDSADLGVKAAKDAVALLSASPAPAGTYPTVMDSSIVGVFAHEAFGHNAEADGVQGGTSILGGKIGETVASPLVTILDDPTMREGYGFYLYDSEGTPATRRVIVEKGVLKGFLHSLETAGRAGEKPNGAGRAQSHQHPPLVRMSNTFIEGGDTPFQDLLKGIDLGVYLKGSSYGYVFVERGQFTVAAQQAWMIRKGEIAEPLRDVAASGMTLETLKCIDAVGNDFRIERSGGGCGKGGQIAATDFGGPSVRVTELVIGGQKGKA